MTERKMMQRMSTIVDDSKNIFRTEQAVSTQNVFGKPLMTKLVCTQGPACWDVPTICNFINKGMTIARLNFSHGDHETHGRTIQNLNEAMRITGKKIGILLDTKGPEIRTGFFKKECNEKITVKAGNPLKLYVDYNYLGDAEGFACSYPQLTTAVHKGSKILCADGSLVLEVASDPKQGDAYVNCIVMNDATIGERKNMNLPNVKVELPVCGPKEKDDFLNFGIPQGVHYIAASFVQCAQDVHDIRSVLGEHAKKIMIISKIENIEGIVNFSEILEASDGIMVARGDMGMEIPPQKVFVAQKMMIAKCNSVGKPVITATQMLESMCNNPRPTRAEASDVANAVIDGTDLVMLSGESAGGKFPLESVTALGDICREAELTISAEYEFSQTVKRYAPTNNTESIALSACAGILKRDVKAIVCVTESGSTARAIARLRPTIPIVAITTNDLTVRHLQCVRAVFPLEVSKIPETPTECKELVIKSCESVLQKGYITENDDCCIVYGMNTGIGSTNSLAFM